MTNDSCTYVYLNITLQEALDINFDESNSNKKPQEDGMEEEGSGTKLQRGYY